MNLQVEVLKNERLTRLPICRLDHIGGWADLTKSMPNFGQWFRLEIVRFY